MPVTRATAPTALVRGGTTTAASDKALAAQREDTRKRRAAVDQMRAMKRADPESTVLKTHRLGGAQSHASIVLALKHPKDNTIMDWMVCELSQQGTDDGAGELMLVMCCPRCVFKLGRPPGEAQFHIRQSNRRFYFTPNPPKWNQEGGHIWRNPKDPNEVVTIAGTIDLPEWGYCPNQGCRWRFTIEDSIIHTR
jgi:hypothetical protein